MRDSHWHRRVLGSILAVAAAGAAASAVRGEEAPKLSIGIAIGRKQVVLGSTKGFVLEDPRDGRRLRSFGPGGKVKLMSRGSGIRYGGKTTALRLVVEPLGQGVLHLDGKAYRGGMQIREAGRGELTVVNVVDVESYLYGVVRAEMPPQSPLEALKAQAIISRTFALKNHQGARDKGFGLKATEESQVYQGMKAETPEAIAAVDATRGIVLSHERQLANVFYSASCGGVTEGSDVVWGGAPEPYLRSVECGWCRSYAGHSWQARIDLTTMESKLRAKGFPVGRIDEITLERSASGRVKELVLQTSRGRVVVPGNKFRLAMGSREIRSQRFQFLQQVALGPDGADVQSDTGEPELAIRQIIHDYIRQTSHVTRSGSGGVLRLGGTGFGHGVGLCQWGAKGQAEHGLRFHEILGYYYEGTQLARAY